VDIKTEHTSNAEAIVTVQVDEERVQSAMRSAAARVSRVRPIHGFRPGKAPYETVERIYGKEMLREEAIEEVAQSVYKQVLKDENIQAYAPGQLHVEQKEPLIFKFHIPTRPAVTLGEYRSLHLQPRPITINDDELSEVLTRVQREYAQLAPVERAVQLDDVVTFDLRGGFADQAPADNKGMQIAIKKDSSAYPWVEQLVGAQANETRAVSYTYTAEDVPALAGKTVQYSITISDIKEEQLPPVDDDLAKMAGVETLDLLKNNLRDSLRRQKEIEEENRFADQVIDEIIAKSQIVFPDVMLNDQIDQEISREQALARQLGLEWDKYLQLTGKTGDALREEIRPRAENKIKRLLTIVELVNVEKIAVTPDQVNAEIDRQVALAVQQGTRENQARRQLSQAQTRRDIEMNLKMRRAVDRVVAIAKGEPTSGKILTPDMVIEEQRARERAALAASTAAAPPGKLITDPSQARAGDWISGLKKALGPNKNQ